MLKSVVMAYHFIGPDGPTDSHFLKNVYTLKKRSPNHKHTRPVVVGGFGQLVDVDAPFKVELKPEEGHEKESAVVPPYLEENKERIKNSTSITKLLSF